MFSVHVIVLSLAIAGSMAYVPNIIYPPELSLIKLKDYDLSARPPGLENQDDPINVTVNIFLRSLDSLDYDNHEFKIQITLREEWTDWRLNFTGYDKEITTNSIDQFWTPDIFFSNEVAAHLHTIARPNAFVRIDSTGKILLSSRISLTLKCPMFLAKFPFDTQTCTIRMPSYGYTTGDVQLQWKEDNPIQVTKTMNFVDFILNSVEPSDCTQVTNTGAYGCLEATFVFERISLRYTVRVLLPLIALVLASWAPFWLPSSTVTRLTVSGLLSLITTIYTLYEKQALGIPSFTVLDFWLSVSTLFVYLAFFELLVLNYQETLAHKSDPQDPEAAESSKVKTIFGITFPSEVHPTDAVCRILFPSAYLIFNILFFIGVYSFM